jgi:hypothetical protein
VAFALIGIVAMQLWVVKLGVGIGRAIEHTELLQRENSALAIEDSALSSGERIEQLALAKGMVPAAPGALHFDALRGPLDARLAAAALARPIQAQTTSSSATAGTEASTAAGTETSAATGTEASAAATAAGTETSAGTEANTAAGTETSATPAAAAGTDASAAATGGETSTTEGQTTQAPTAGAPTAATPTVSATAPAATAGSTEAASSPAGSGGGTQAPPGG